MKQLMSDELWPTIERLACYATTRRGAVAFVTADDIVEFGEGDVLVTDASRPAIASGLTSARLLHRAFRRGAELYSLPGLHAKVMVLDDIAVVGSANISNSSRKHLIEAAWVTDDVTARGAALSMIAQLARKSEVIDHAFITRILAIDVDAPRRRALRRATPGTFKTPRPRTWIATVHELATVPEADRGAIEAGTAEVSQSLPAVGYEPSWIRSTSNTLFRRQAAVGDAVIQIFYPIGRVRPTVYRPAIIRARRTNRRCSLVFLEEPTAGTLAMAAFQRLLGAAGLRRAIGATPTCQLRDDIAEKLVGLW